MMDFRRIQFFVCSMLAAGFVFAAEVPREVRLSLIPYPASVVAFGGMTTNGHVRHSFDGSIPREGYKMEIGDGGIDIASSDDAGKFYAAMTLRQLKSDAGYPKVRIEDAPRFRWRGVHLDDVRHFFGKETVKRLLDQMSWYKFNVFHWHLTDMQAWLIDIPGYPELVKQGKGRKFGEKVGPFYYTAADIREILDYARARHIEVVPEVEFPGHFSAVVRAYPEFACPVDLTCPGGKAMCIGNPEAVRFAERVLDYVCELFPSRVIHVGGDECTRDYWKKCPKCRAFIAHAGLGGVGGLQPWLTRHLAEYLDAKGRRALGWDEIFDGTGYKLPKTTMGMCWRLDGAGAEAANNGYEIIRCPTSHCYLDYRQGLEDDPYLYFGKKTISLRDAYAFDPLAGVEASAHVNVAGGQCCNWSECTYNRFDLEWKLWPRAFAIAEVLWSYPDPSNRNYANFEARSAEHRRRLIRSHVNCAPVGQVKEARGNQSGF